MAHAFNSQFPTIVLYSCSAQTLKLYCGQTRLLNQLLCSIHISSWQCSQICPPLDNNGFQIYQTEMMRIGLICGTFALKQLVSIGDRLILFNIAHRAYYTPIGFRFNLSLQPVGDATIQCRIFLYLLDLPTITVYWKSVVDIFLSPTRAWETSIRFCFCLMLAKYLPSTGKRTSIGHNWLIMLYHFTKTPSCIGVMFKNLTKYGRSG